MRTAITNALATFRLTKLILDDEIIREPREAVQSFLDEHNGNPLADKASYFISCPWCVSIWAGAAVYFISKSKASFLTDALASSAVAGIIYEQLG